jgi:hypothetical protein
LVETLVKEHASNIFLLLANPLKMGLRQSRDSIVSTGSTTVRKNSNISLNLPKRVILIRHAESLGNIDPSAYGHTPDWEIPLTMNGIEQSRALGLELKDRVGDGL